jgi:hypothetical protein
VDGVEERSPLKAGSDFGNTSNTGGLIERAREEIAALGRGRRGLARLGAGACAALALAVATHRLFSEALPGQDHWASLNSSLGYTARTFPPDEFIGSGAVAENARFWMPRNARYRVVFGDEFVRSRSPWRYAAPSFLAGFLLPRRQTDSRAARWIFCIGCARSALGPSFEVLSDGGNGVLFGRTRG